MSIEGIGAGAVPPVGVADMKDVATGTASDYARGDLMSAASENAFATFTDYPGRAARESGLKDQILADSRGNPHLPADYAEKQPEALSDQFITKISGLYNEVTIYQVAWNMAKRSGRDIETLLKAQ